MSINSVSRTIALNVLMQGDRTQNLHLLSVWLLLWQRTYLLVSLTMISRKWLSSRSNADSAWLLFMLSSQLMKRLDQWLFASSSGMSIPSKVSIAFIWFLHLVSLRFISRRILTRERASSCDCEGTYKGVLLRLWAILRASEESLRLCLSLSLVGSRMNHDAFDSQLS